jgi:drug/metabolite transporter (DMT)-like permease
VSLVAVVLVFTAAFLHIGWNAIVKTSGDPLETSTWAMGLGALVLVPAAAIGWLATGRPALEPPAWVIGALSGIVEVAYFVQLSAAYRHGALSSVYPVARGSSAVLGAAIGVIVLGERLAPLGLLGVGLLLAGITAAALPGARRATLVPALLTGCAIAGYSALDRVGVRMGPAWLYAAVIWGFTSVGLVAFVGVTRRATSVAGAASEPPGALAVRRQAVGRGPRATSLGRSLAAGLLMIATYMLVLLALQVAPLSGVSPLRESATVLAAAWGVVALGERDHAAWRVGGAVAVAVGAMLLALSG